MRSICEMLVDLVAIRSDTGTPTECGAAKRIFELLMEDPYFQENPDMCGMYDKGDCFGRPVVWGLKKGSTGRTVILTGHYDAVETSCYGVFEPLSLSPEPLRNAMLESGSFSGEVLKDLQDDNWMFGRGAADMKAGIAINLHMLRNYEFGEKGILFTAVCDEENLSAGARQAIGLYEELKEKHGLDYVYAAITEPLGTKQVGNGVPVPLLDGATGKILPVVVVKGKLAHSAYVMNGLNSALILAEIIRGVDLNTDFLSNSMGICNQPGSTQIFFDMKKDYDVSIPEYSAAGFNLTYYADTDPMEQLKKLEKVCLDACDTVVERYNKVFDQMTAANQIDPSYRVEYYPQVMTLAQLKEMLADKPGFAQKDKSLQAEAEEKIRSGELTMQKAGIGYIRALMDLAELTAPAVVVGVVPPFYPTVTNQRLSKSIQPMLERTSKALESEGIPITVRPYSQGMNDTSYMSCANPASAMVIMDNMAISKDIYSIDFAALARLNIPTQLVGPAARNVHQMAERVYLPDVEETIPRVLQELIKQA